MLSNTNNVYLQYKENSILTASPEELVLMLYNGLVKFLLQAMKAMEDKEIEKANTAVKRAQDIVVELQASLDKKYELSKGLDLIYDYMQMWRLLLKKRTVALKFPSNIPWTK
jgi:flagellar protein FliS